MVLLTIPQTTTASVIVPRGKTSGNPPLRRDWSEEGGGDQDDQTCQFVQENCRQRGINGHRSRACLSDPVSTETQTAGETPLKSARAQIEEDVDGDICHLETCRKSLSGGNGRGASRATESEKVHLKKRVGMKPKLHQSQWQPKGFGNGPTNVIGLCCDGVALVLRSLGRLPMEEVTWGPSRCRFGPDPTLTDSLQMDCSRSTDGRTHRQIRWKLTVIPLVQFKCVCQKTKSPWLSRLRIGMDSRRGIRADRWPLAYQSEPEESPQRSDRMEERRSELLAFLNRNRFGKTFG